MNSANDEIMPCEPWTLERLHGTFQQINELLTDSTISQDFRDSITTLITLSRQIVHPENINADFLGFYTINLMRILDEDEPDIDEVIQILDSLLIAFNDEISEQTTNIIAMAVIDIHFNDTYSIFSNLFEPKQNSEIDYIGKLEFDLSKLTYDIIITG